MLWEGWWGSLRSRLTLQSLRAMSPLPWGAQTAASLVSGEEGMCRTMGEGIYQGPPTHLAGARTPQIPSFVARTFHLPVGLVSFPSLGPGHVRTNPCPYPTPSRHSPPSHSLGTGATSDFLLPVWAAGPFLERFGSGQRRAAVPHTRGAGHLDPRRGFPRPFSVPSLCTHP